MTALSAKGGVVALHLDAPFNIFTAQREDIILYAERQILSLREALNRECSKTAQWEKRCLELSKELTRTKAELQEVKRRMLSLSTQGPAS